MAEAQARGRARRPPSERVGKNDRLGLLGAAEAGSTGLDPAPLGRADGRRNAAPVRDAPGAGARRTARRPVRTRARGGPGTRTRPEEAALKLTGAGCVSRPPTEQGAADSAKPGRAAGLRGFVRLPLAGAHNE